MRDVRYIIVFCLICLLGYSHSGGKNNPGDSATYYVNSFSGSDDNTGTSPAAAWKTLEKVNSVTFNAGDSILFKSGAKWKGQLRLTGSGSKQFPAVVSSYGEGRRPLIYGDGETDYVLLIEDVSNWHIHNLEITNEADNEGSRIGVLIKANGGKQQHIHLKNLYIHDISGYYSFEMKGKNTGGIGVIGEKDARFDDILIEDCEIANIVRVGIFTNGNTGTRGDRPITNLVIRNNKIHHCAGDGAIIRYADQPLIEYNKVYEVHNAPEDLVKWGVALWCRSTDMATFQFNEVFNTRGSMDGQAFDADLDAYKTIVQYNYSHNNEGGFMLVYGTSSDAIVRYNISVNDGIKGKHIFDFPIWKKPRGSAIIHNNTILLHQGNEAVIADEALPTTHFFNNIFYKEEGGRLVVKSEGKTATFNNNWYIGYDTDSTAIDKKPYHGDPLLRLNNPSTEGLERFKLNNSSPSATKGLNYDEVKKIYWLPNYGNRDFWGTSLPKKDISMGANQVSSAKE